MSRLISSPHTSLLSILLTCTIILNACDNPFSEKTLVSLSFMGCVERADGYTVVAYAGSRQSIHIQTNQDFCGNKTTLCSKRHIESATLNERDEMIFTAEEMVVVSEDDVYFPFSFHGEGEVNLTFTVLTTNGTETVSLRLIVLDQIFLSDFGKCTGLPPEPQNLLVLPGTQPYLELSWHEHSDVRYSAFIEPPMFTSADDSVASITTASTAEVDISGEPIELNACYATNELFVGTSGETDLFIHNSHRVAHLKVVDSWDGFKVDRSAFNDLERFDRVCLTPTLQDQLICNQSTLEFQVSNTSPDRCELISLVTEEAEVVSISENEGDCFFIRSLNDQPCQFDITSQGGTYPITVQRFYD